MIGQLLVATRAISQDQLDQALQEQRQSGALLGDVLVSMKFLTQENLAKALAQEARVPFLSLDGRVRRSRRRRHRAGVDGAQGHVRAHFADRHAPARRPGEPLRRRC